VLEGIEVWLTANAVSDVNEIIGCALPERVPA
jgi:hypothetical protein